MLDYRTSACLAGHIRYNVAQKYFILRQIVPLTSRRVHDILGHFERCLMAHYDKKETPDTLEAWGVCMKAFFISTFKFRSLKKVNEELITLQFLLLGTHRSTRTS